jgi:exopolysaccharide production protein ExoZ
MFFYLVFSFSLFTKDQSLRLFIIGGPLLTLVLLGKIFTLHGLAAFYVSPLVLEFLFGVAIAWSFKADHVLPTHFAVAAVATGLVILLSLQSPSEGLRPLAWGLPAAIAIFGIVSLEQTGVVRKIPALLVLGDASYSIYLTHLFVVGLVEMTWTKLGLPFSGIAAITFIASASVASALGGIVTYRFLERPILRILRSIASAHLPARASRKLPTPS